jgi:hypothetical protein
MVKVRWHGQDKSEDTWQEASDLPRHFVERYAKKKKLSIEDVSGPQQERNESSELTEGGCRKVKFYYPLPGSPSERPLMVAPNRLFSLIPGMSMRVI